jgi:hypothetical protein
MIDENRLALSTLTVIKSCTDLGLFTRLKLYKA